MVNPCLSHLSSPHKLPQITKNGRISSMTHQKTPRNQNSIGGRIPECIKSMLYITMFKLDLWSTFSMIAKEHAFRVKSLCCSALVNKKRTTQSLMIGCAPKLLQDAIRPAQCTDTQHIHPLVPLYLKDNPSFCKIIKHVFFHFTAANKCGEMLLH